jgi:DNA-binding transcriptional ArsR family regulator
VTQPRQPVFKALADPTRRSILKLLRKGSLTAGAIAEAYPITRASLSHHFNVLKDADLVRTERRGQHIVYSLNATVLEETAALLLDLLAPPDKPGNGGGNTRKVSKHSSRNAK